MRVVDLYESEFLTDKNDIIAWIRESFKEFDSDKLTIETDGLVYEGDLSLKYTVTELKVQFKEVTGTFDCTSSKITSLIGCPKIVGYNFACHGVKTITSLEGCPEIVKGNFSCNHTNIDSLKFCPRIVGSTFYCKKTKIINPKEYRFALYCEIGSQFLCNDIEIDKIIKIYGGSASKSNWPKAINLLSRVKL